MLAANRFASTEKLVSLFQASVPFLSLLKNVGKVMVHRTIKKNGLNKNRYLARIYCSKSKKETPANVINMFKVTYKNIRGVSIVDFQHISHLFLVFLLLTLNR